MAGAGMMPMPYDYAPRSSEHWSGGGGYGGFDGMPREGAEILHRMAPLLNLLATAGGGGGYGGSSAQSSGPGGAGGWGQGGGQGGVGPGHGQTGYGAHNYNHNQLRDNPDGRYRPY